MESSTLPLPTRPPCPRDPKTKVSGCPCQECRVKVTKLNLPHPLFRPPNMGKMRDYVEVDQNDSEKSITMLREPGSTTTHYERSAPETKAVICDDLDSKGVLFISGVIPPPGYSRQAKCVKRDTPVQRTSDRPPRHKQERGTCPKNECSVRTGMCECLCHTCKGYSKECGCCKTCCNKEGECVCHP